MMTKQHYIQFAKALYNVRPLPGDNQDRCDQWEQAYNLIVHVLADDNPRFDLQRFRHACDEGMIQARPGAKPIKAF